MIIESDKVVSFHYSLVVEDDGFSEDSRSGDPMVYLHDHGGVIPGLEAALEGKKVRDKFSITLEPGEAYGQRREGKVQRIPIKHLASKGKPTVGALVSINTDSGIRDAIVIKVGRFVVDVDTNHPLAGKMLTFDVEVIEIREATAEELAHGHVHGPGGHHH